MSDEHQQLISNDEGFGLLCKVLFGFTPDQAPAVVADDIAELRELHLKHAKARRKLTVAIAKKLEEAAPKTEPEAETKA